ncbi:type II toxin-antitoxin system RelB/DinJ family antitoxin [bacterium]|nr:type II toxin-antitoxin system RelB/DinJ family antitoxin [bacterium]
MARTAVIQARIDPEIKKKAQNIFSELNITMSEAISLFLTQVTLNRGIPFDIRIPNRLTARTLSDSETGKELHQVSDVNELFKELDI